MGDSWPVLMFVKEKDNSFEPLEVEEFTFKSVGEILRDEGLAFPLRTGSGTVMCDLVSCGGDGSGITGAGLEVINEVSTETNEAESTSFCWINAELPNSPEFVGNVSHVDWDCNLYISSISDNQDNLRIIGSVLDSKYSGSSPSPSDLRWSPGQACIA